jgi:AraC-like DNA-binding protein
MKLADLEDPAAAGVRAKQSGTGDEPSRQTLPELISSILGKPSARELVPLDPASLFRWFEHDYPAPMARWNHHPEFELHLIRRGTGSTLVGDYAGRFAAGHVALIGPNLPHDWMSDLAPGEIVRGRDLVIQFDGDRLRQAIGILPELEELDPLLRDAGRGIEFTGKTAAAVAPLMEAIGGAHGLERLQLLLSVFAALARAPGSERRLLASPIFSAAAGGQLDTVLRYIMNHRNGDIRLAQAAQLAGMSETGFSRAFKRMAGRTFVDFVRKIRVAQACRLLRQTSLPVSSICFDVGFGNVSNFNRQFRTEMGLNPTEYRRQINC